MTNLELTKNELLKFYEQNKNLLNLDTPFEKWDDSVILFSSNDSVKGKVYFKHKTIEFKLKHKQIKTDIAFMHFIIAAKFANLSLQIFNH